MTMPTRAWLPLLVCFSLGCTQLDRNASGLESGGSSTSGATVGTGGEPASGGEAGTGGDGTGGAGGSGGKETGGAETGGTETGGAETGGAMTGGEQPASGGAATGGDPGTGGDEPTGNLSCTQNTLERNYASTTTKAGDDSVGTCGGQGSDDVAVLWTPPRDAWYRLDTFESDYDTVLYTLDVDCDGAELSCSDDALGGTQSEIVARFPAGRQVVVVVDGKDGASGNGVVRATEITCPGEDIDLDSLPITRNTAQGDTSHTAACGSVGSSNGPERSYRFVPPDDGLYRFSVTSAAFTPSIFLELGPACGGELLACNQGVQDGYAAEVTRYLTGGEPVTLIVDSTAGQGTFELNAARLDESVECPVGTDYPAYPVGIASDDLSVLSGSCVRAGGPAAPNGFPEYTALFPISDLIPAGASRTITVESYFPFAFYVLRGARCDGPEVMCALAEPDTDGFFTASFTYDATMAGDYVIVVEATGSGGLTYAFANH